MSEEIGKIVKIMEEGYIQDDRFKRIFLELLKGQACGLLPICESVIDAIRMRKGCDKIVTFSEKNIV